MHIVLEDLYKEIEMLKIRIEALENMVYDELDSKDDDIKNLPSRTKPVYWDDCE